MVLMDDELLYEHSKSLRNLCFSSKRFVHEKLGWNFRMTNLQAALGVAQLEQLDAAISKKRAIGLAYDNALQDFEVVQSPVPETDYAQNVYWVYGLVTHDPSECERLITGLGEQGIGTRPFFWPMHEQPVFQDQYRGSFPNAEKLARCGFYLPSGLGLTQDQQARVIITVKGLLT